MRVTVCELNEDPLALKEEWPHLAEHVRRERSRLVLLPEMPFSSWFPARPRFDPQVWDAVVLEHERGLLRLLDLAPAEVISSRPIEWQGRRYNEGFAWSTLEGYRTARHKVDLPNREGLWEAAWYGPGEPNARLVEAGGAQVGLLIGCELWSLEQARQYGRAGADLLACPRAALDATGPQWLARGQAASQAAGAYGLSSNRRTAEWGGMGWAIDPGGTVLGVTSPEAPFLTVEIDLGR